MDTECPRCGSDKIIPKVPLADRYGDAGAFSSPANVHVHGDPDAWFFKDTVAGQVTLRVCGGCGYAELNVANHRELYEKYRDRDR